jgi:hypothetical protein
MFMRSLICGAVLGALAITHVEAISKVSIKGSKFFFDNGDQFYIKGMSVSVILSINNS